MFHFQEIRSAATDNYGYVTAETAAKLGITTIEMTRWTQSGRLERHARGLYRVADYPPSPLEPFVRAVLLVGAGARIYGESVLGMLNLAPMNPTWIHVGTFRRLRRRIPDGIKIVKTDKSTRIENYDGINSQPVIDAIRVCRRLLNSDRILHATDEAYRQGYISSEECKILKEEIVNEATA